MIKFLGLAVAAALTATASEASAAQLLLYPIDYNDYKSVNGAAYAASFTPDKRNGRIGQSYVYYASGSQTATYMAAAEFDLSSLPQNINVTSATLVDLLNPEYVSSSPSNLTVTGTEYIGDGSITAADVIASGTPFSFTGMYRLRLDTTSFIQSLITSGDRFSGFSFSLSPPNGCAIPAGSIGSKNCSVDLPFFSSSTSLQNYMNLTVNYDVLAPAAAAVPEPTTWAMMLVGFGAVGFGMRRRRKVTTQVSYAA